MCADYLDKVQKALGTCPSSFVRVERMPEAEGVVARVTVFRRGPRLGVNAWEVLGALAVRRVRRLLVEADPDVDRVGLAYDVKAREVVR